MANDHSQNLKVILRLRPLLRRESKQNKRHVLRVVDRNSIVFDPLDDGNADEDTEASRCYDRFARKDLKMSFDRVFGSEATNFDIFHYAMRPLVLSVLKGYNCTAFVYGVTGAGKTYTMLGTERYRGVVYLTMEELFKQIEPLRTNSNIEVRVSYVEVYNEQVRNLLTRAGPLKLREDAAGVVIEGVVPQRICDCDDVIALLLLGNHNRAQHPTDANYKSSRSHAIFQVHVVSTNPKSGLTRVVKLSMIDLGKNETGNGSLIHSLVSSSGLYLFIFV